MSLTMMLGRCWGGRLVINTKTTGFVDDVVSLAEVPHHLLHVQVLGSARSSWGLKEVPRNFPRLSSLLLSCLSSFSFPTLSSSLLQLLLLSSSPSSSPSCFTSIPWLSRSWRPLAWPGRVQPSTIRGASLWSRPAVARHCSRWWRCCYIRENSF